MEDNTKLIQDIKQALRQLAHNGVPTKNIFDALRETETKVADYDNEMILKHLIKHFKNKTKEKWNGIAVVDIVKYLENQSEKKHTEVVPKFRVGDKVKKGYLTYTVEDIDEDSYKLQAYSKDGDKGCTAFLSIGCEKDYELVEQNPANFIWHEMTEKPEGDANDRTLVVFEDGHSITSNALLHIGFGTYKSYKWAYVNDILRLTSNTKQIEQKPWSEADEDEMAIAIAHLFKDCQYDTVDWLKSLKERVQPQPKQEWNEEDKKHVHSIISTIECCRKENERSKVVADAYTSDLEWFKSLMNRCKPSEDLPHWKKGTLKGKNVTGFNSDFFSHNGYYINYNELFDKLPKDE